MKTIATVRRTADGTHVCEHKLVSEEELRNLTRLYPWPTFEIIEENW